MRKRIVLATGLIAIAAALFWGLRIYTPRITDDAKRPGAAIASLEQVNLGGQEQWILIRGRDRDAPIALFLHGGPGMPMMYLAYRFQRVLEDKFLVVQWDRRGQESRTQPGPLIHQRCGSARRSLTRSS